MPRRVQSDVQHIARRHRGREIDPLFEDLIAGKLVSDLAGHPKDARFALTHQVEF